LQRLDTKKLALASILGALAAASEVIKGPPFDIPFPLMPGTVSWDLTGMPMILSLLFTGPIGAIYTTVIGCSIIFLRGNVSGGTLKLVAELATILAFAVIRKGIITKSIAAVMSRVLVMTIANFYLLQLFYVWATEAYVVGLLFPLGIFNATQALLNIIPAYIIYSRLCNKWRLWGTKDNSP
jgi:riboflavin transporter FmnP